MASKRAFASGCYSQGLAMLAFVTLSFAGSSCVTQRSFADSPAVAKALALPDSSSVMATIGSKRICVVTEVGEEVPVQKYREDQRSRRIKGQVRRGNWLYYVTSDIGHVWEKGDSSEHLTYFVLKRYKV